MFLFETNLNSTCISMSKGTVPVEFQPEPFPLIWKYFCCAVDVDLQPNQAYSVVLLRAFE